MQFYVRRFAAILLLPLASAQSPSQAPHLSLCGKCYAPTVTKQSGFGTSAAAAEARVTQAEIKGWCENWTPGDAGCFAREWASVRNTVYNASADCTSGRIMAIDGESYTVAGIWADGFGQGRVKFKNAAGSIVGADEASGGLAIAQQWSVLCPGPLKIGARARTPAPGASAAASRAAAPAAAPAPVCGGTPQCTEVQGFAATVVDFRTSTASHYRIVSTMIRFQNKLSRPIVLGYVNGSGIVTDDQGNRYQISSGQGVRGIGMISGNQVDPKFILAAGATADARFEFAWSPSRGQIFGETYDLDLTVREVVPLQNRQLRLGAEFPLRFERLADAQRAMPPVSSAAPASVAAEPVTAAAAVPAADPVPAAAIAPQVDHCAGVQRCYNAGPFTVQALRVVESKGSNGRRVLNVHVSIRNVSTQQLVLAYQANSALAIDNQGNRFGAYDAGLTGLGRTSSGRIDPRFSLAPGASGTASFTLMHRSNGVMGNIFTVDFGLEQAEVLNAQQVRTVREYAVHFDDLTAPQSANAPQGLQQSGQQIIDLFRKKKR